MLLSSFLLVSCSSEINVLGYLANPTFTDNAVDQLSMAQVYYDEGDFDKALTAAERAYELDPESELAAVVLSSVHMALAGIDTFQLVKKLISNNSDEELVAENAAGSLAELSDLVGISTDEYDLLTLEGNVKDGVEGAPSSGIFQDLPVLLPKTAPDARSSGGDTIYHIDQAIQALCPFVGEEIKITEGEGDIRHRASACPPLYKNKYRSKSHFNWAFAHLTEALLFNAVVLYAPEGGTANLQKRGDILDDSNQVGSIGEYVGAVADLAAVTEIILPTESESAENSMLLAMFNDLDAASRAFSSLSGIPPSVTSGIVSSLQGLEEQRNQISQSDSEGNASSKALKGQLTSGLAAEIRGQMTAKEEAGELSNEDKVELCESYQSISTEEFALCEAT